LRFPDNCIYPGLRVFRSGDLGRNKKKKKTGFFLDFYFVCVLMSTSSFYGGEAGKVLEENIGIPASLKRENA